MACSTGGYTIARHNDVRDLLAGVLSEVLPDVEVEPMLAPFDGEDLPHRTANRKSEARLDVKARGFWSRQQEAFFDVRVTHPKPNLLSRPEVQRHLQKHEGMKKREYGARVVNID